MKRKNVDLLYPVLLFLTIGKKSFQNIGRIVKMTGRAIANIVPSAEKNFSTLETICQSDFKNKKKFI